MRIRCMLLRLWLIVAFVGCGIVVPSYSNSASLMCGFSLGPCSSTSIQGLNLFNSQTTGAATTAVVVTLTAVAQSRSHVYKVDARCNTAAATSDVTITDGGVTIWTSGLLAVGAVAPFYQMTWPTGLTGTTNSAVVITLAACTAGTGTMIVQADRY